MRLSNLDLLRHYRQIENDPFFCFIPFSPQIISTISVDAPRRDILHHYNTYNIQVLRASACNLGIIKRVSFIIL